MFHFTIRELVLLVALVAMGLGWWVDRNALAVSRNQAFADCCKLGCFCVPGKHIGEEVVRTQVQPIWDKYCAFPRPPEVEAAWRYNRRRGIPN
jgi:hypothetical protein